MKSCCNCFFSTYAFSTDRPALICRQRVGYVGRLHICRADERCANFYPSGAARSTMLPSTMLHSTMLMAGMAGTTCNPGNKGSRRIPLTLGMFAIVDAADYPWLIRYRWFAVKSGNTYYAVRAEKRKCIRMHRVILNAPEGLPVDHIDHNGLNNRRSNLRVCTTSQNCRNRRPLRNTSSKYKGVNFAKHDKIFRAVIGLNGKLIHLGCFKDEIEAAKAYDKKAKELFGEFACLNF